MRGDAAEVAWPALLTSARASLVALLYQMEDTQWLPADVFVQNQMRQVGKLVAHAATQSPFFRQRLEKAGLKPEDLATPEGFRRLPPMTRRDIQDAQETLFCASSPPTHMPAWEATTSGSTGEKVKVRKTQLSSLYWVALTLRGHFWYARDMKKRLMAVRDGIPEVQNAPDWGFPISQLFDSGPMRIVPGWTPAPEYERHIRDFRPHYLIAYPSVLAAIMEESRRKNMPIEGVEHVMTIGERLSPEQAQDIAAFFNARVIDVYSSTETGNTAVQCPESGLYHVMGESVLLEILDDKGNPCAAGEVGKVVMTDLSNYATPMIRYAIGDYAEAGGACSCGRALPTVKRFLGRERNLALRPDGTKYWPVIGAVMFHEVASEVRQAQFVQLDRNTLEVRLSTDAPVAPAQEERFREMIYKALGCRYTVNFVYFSDRLPASSNGKFDDFICQAS